MNLIIGNKKVRMVDGLYCLNDLHKASGSESKNKPALYLTNKKTKDYLQTVGIPTVTVEGRNGGTYAHKKVVYDYAMWISPVFKDDVIEAYDALVTGQLQEMQRSNSTPAPVSVQP